MDILLTVLNFHLIVLALSLRILVRKEVFTSIINIYFFEFCTSFDLLLFVKFVKIKSEIQESNIIMSPFLVLLLPHNLLELFKSNLILLPYILQRLNCLFRHLQRIYIHLQVVNHILINFILLHRRVTPSQLLLHLLLHLLMLDLELLSRGQHVLLDQFKSEN